MALAQQVPFGALPSQKFDMTTTVQDVFERAIKHGGELNKAIGQLELIAQINNRELLTCLQAVVGNEECIKRVLSIFIEHIIFT